MTPATVLLALSYAPDLGEAERRRLEERAAEAVRRAGGGEAARASGGAARTGEGVLERAGVAGGLVLLADGPLVDVAGTGRVVPLVHGARTTGGQALDAAALAARLARGDARDVAPPFAACLLDERDAGLLAVTDTAGLRHVYWLQAVGWAAVSTSSLALAVLAGADLDAEAIGIFALVGNHLGERTPFAGVRVLPAGGSVRLTAGEAHVASTPAHGGPAVVMDRRSAVSAGVEVVRELTAACLRAAPDPLMELSGGLDSRMLLAAIPVEARAGLRAVTIGPSGSADHRVATTLARRHGLAHRHVTLDGLASLPDAEVAGLAEAAALARDCGGNPVALAVLDWQERELDQGPRLSGQNGEFARGFYYAGQRAHPHVTEDLVDALARWRIFTNEAADPELFAAGFVEDMRSAALAAVRRAFADHGGPWLAATDEFYLRERMRRWVGVAYSDASTRRPVLAPFFQPAYLEWARACAPADKRGSRIFAEVLRELDPELAAVPLDSGRAPGAIASPSPVDRLAAATGTLRKVVRKVDQRVRRRGRPASGAGLVAGGVQRAWSQRSSALEEVAGLPFLDSRAVEEAATARRLLDPASVGLLVDLDVARRALR